MRRLLHRFARLCLGESQEEIDALAELVGQSLEEFERKYVRRIGVRRSLIEFPNGDCVFFDGQARKCTVYDARPRQCRTWPFWQSNLRTEKDWQQTCEVCPGSGRGNLVPVEQIIEQLNVLRI